MRVNGDETGRMMQSLPCPAASLQVSRDAPGAGVLSVPTIHGFADRHETGLDIRPVIENRPPPPCSERMMDGRNFALPRPDINGGVADVQTLGDFWTREKAGRAVQRSLIVFSFVPHDGRN